MTGVFALLFGSLCGIALLFRVLFGLGCLFGDDDGGRGAAIRKAKADWWKSLSASDKRDFKRHEKRKRQYVRLREKLYHEVRRRRRAGFEATGVDPDLRAANEVWNEWNMNDWDDINLAPDCPPVMSSDGGVIDFSPKKADWTPPKWR